MAQAKVTIDVVYNDRQVDEEYVRSNVELIKGVLAALLVPQPSGK